MVFVAPCVFAKGRRMILTAEDIEAIADAVWDEPMSGHNVSNSFGQYIPQLGDYLTNQLDFLTDLVGNVPGLVWDFSTSSIQTSGSIGEFLLAKLADVAQTVWEADLGTYNTIASTFGQIISDYLDQPISATNLNTAGQVWEELAANHLNTGSLGELATALRDLINGLKGRDIKIVSPVANAGKSVETVWNIDYQATDGFAVDFVNEEGTWIDLTDSTPEVTLAHLDGKIALVKEGEVITPTGPSQTIRFEFRRDEIKRVSIGRHKFELLVTLANGNIPPPLLIGEWNVPPRLRP